MDSNPLFSHAHLNSQESSPIENHVRLAIDALPVSDSHSSMEDSYPIRMAPLHPIPKPLEYAYSDQSLSDIDLDSIPTPSSSSVDDLSIENPPSPSGSDQRFQYSPKTFLERLLVSFHIKNKLDTSKVVQVPFSPSYRYSLLILLLLVTAFLTPSLLPRWIGFEWASAEDLCQNPDSKLDDLENFIHNHTRLKQAQHFLVSQKFHLECMNVSAAKFFHGPKNKPPRFAWPTECDSKKAKVSLTEERCTAQKADVCKAVGGIVGFFMSVGGNCVREVGPEKCVNVTDTDRARALLELEKQRPNPQPANVSEIESSPFVKNANSKVQALVSRLITQVDIAADAFIIYSIISIAVGVPLIIYKREKGSQIVGATFGLTKIWFIVVFIIIITVYDSSSTIFRETNFPKLIRNFFRDPCYVNPRFNANRIAKIVDTCSNITYISEQSEHVLQLMDDVYFNAKLFGFCKDESRSFAVHPKLKELDQLRAMYRNKNFTNPGICNATELIEMTSEAPKDGASWWKVVMGSGVFAQLILKFVVTSWVLHVFAYIDPLVMNNGKVEVWGTRKGSRLTIGEEEAVTRFARDKHLLSLLVFSVLLAFEVVLIIYSIASNANSGGPVPHVPEPIRPEDVINLRCPASIFP